MEENLETKLYENIKGINLIVGKKDSGKTYFVLNTLIPFLKNKNINSIYFEECMMTDFFIPTSDDVAIFDEFETFFDKDFLENKYNDQNYYKDSYITKVKNLFNTIGGIDIPKILILTRNLDDEIENILNNMKKIDWGDEIKVFNFEKYVNKLQTK